jgi:hypothetical protein
MYVKLLIFLFSTRLVNGFEPISYYNPITTPNQNPASAPVKSYFSVTLACCRNLRYSLLIATEKRK